MRRSGQRKTDKTVTHVDDQLEDVVGAACPGHTLQMVHHRGHVTSRVTDDSSHLERQDGKPTRYISKHDKDKDMMT